MLGGPSSPVNQSIDYGFVGITTPATPLQITTGLAAAVLTGCTFVEVQVSELSARPITFGLTNAVRAGSGASIANRVGVAVYPGESKIFYVTDADQIWFDAENTADKFTFSVYK